MIRMEPTHTDLSDRVILLVSPAEKATLRYRAELKKTNISSIIREVLGFAPRLHGTPKKKMALDRRIIQE